ncbi:MAG: hypothetical protein R3E12_04340 [Candidatus Eisenbacteria bacterium]
MGFAAASSLGDSEQTGDAEKQPERRDATTLRVQLKSTGLRKNPTAFERPFRKLDYATEVAELRNDGPWTEVRVAAAPDTSGWLYASALTKARIYKSPEDAPRTASEASGSVVQISDRGFGQKDVKRQFLNMNPEVDSLDFVLVDRMEASGIDLDSLRVFLESGGLRSGKEGAAP